MKIKVITEYKKIDYDNIIKIFGDSHCLCFFGSSMQNKYLDIEYNNNKLLVINCNQDSVTISGLNKEKSKLGYNNRIVQNIEKESNIYHLFKLGQVDIEFVYYYKLFVKKENISKDDFYEKIISQYLDFIKNLNVNIIVCGSNLPGLPNIEANIKYLSYIIGIDISEIKKYNFSLQNKMEDVINFNNKLKKQCIKMNILYFDLIEESIEIKDGDYFLKDIFQEGGIHYKGGNGMVEEKLNDEMDYINNNKYKHTYLKKLLDTLLD
jgi:hypothetical protein